MLNFFNGSATAMITPFTKEGGVNFDAFGKMIDFQIENGTDMPVSYTHPPSATSTPSI